VDASTAFSRQERRLEDDGRHFNAGYVEYKSDADSGKRLFGSAGGDDDDDELDEYVVIESNVANDVDEDDDDRYTEADDHYDDDDDEVWVSPYGRNVFGQTIILNFGRK
jgi:hypothetical protein